MASNVVANGLQFLKRRRQSQSKKARTYILPTRFGMAFGLMSLVLFFMAVGYANNLIYIFFFFLTSVAFTGMVITNRNVQAVSFSRILPGEVFAQEEGRLRVELQNTTMTTSFEIEVVTDRKTKEALRSTVAPEIESVVPVAWTPAKRGMQSAPTLRIQGSYPFGLLQAWKVIKSPGSVLVFPARQGVTEFPMGSGADSVAESMGLFLNHKIYQSGDPVRRIDWKASARRNEVLIKKYEEPEKPALNFSWEQTESLRDPELRLSQMALWIDQAEAQNYVYSMRIGAVQTPSAKGREHWRRCLELLALAKVSELP
ncbi:DUF58 domain-containing protein [Bdellovibrio sp. SKB1291214]|uniref:DUF58 domain-containing protein n=1 Tax=Bdellovibrio sp. SKB1291214 TaxID=1732569 RepID=UPI00223F4905|nr:DUF58 domain-containing protein [Bdellovibrio sp. SKB1291214]UYL08954.1 DUF58 domain-containing protein [Bdellovibrio sp. SKB1291214]